MIQLSFWEFHKVNYALLAVPRSRAQRRKITKYLLFYAFGFLYSFRAFYTLYCSFTSGCLPIVSSAFIHYIITKSEKQSIVLVSSELIFLKIGIFLDFYIRFRTKRLFETLFDNLYNVIRNVESLNFRDVLMQDPNELIRGDVSFLGRGFKDIHFMTMVMANLYSKVLIRVTVLLFLAFFETITCRFLAVIIYEMAFWEMVVFYLDAHIYAFYILTILICGTQAICLAVLCMQDLCLALRLLSRRFRSLSVDKNRYFRLIESIRRVYPIYLKRYTAIDKQIVIPVFTPMIFLSIPFAVITISGIVASGINSREQLYTLIILLISSFFGLVCYLMIIYISNSLKLPAGSVISFMASYRARFRCVGFRRLFHFLILYEKLCTKKPFYFHFSYFGRIRSLTGFTFLCQIFVTALFLSKKFDI